MSLSDESDQETESKTDNQSEVLMFIAVDNVKPARSNLLP